MRHAGIVLAAVSCLSIFTYSQTAEELVNKNIQAKGGIEKMKAIHSVRITGKLNGEAVSPLPRCRRTSVQTWCARPLPCKG